MGKLALPTTSYFRRHKTMINIDGEDYSIEVIRKALKLYESLQDGTLEKEIMEKFK